MFVYLPHLIQGDASKSESEVDIYARSLDDVSGCKKDLSPSSGETHIVLFTLFRAQQDFLFCWPEDFFLALSTNELAPPNLIVGWLVDLLID